MAAAAMAGCATGQGPAYLTTASLPTLTKLQPFAPASTARLQRPQPVPAQAVYTQPNSSRAAPARPPLAAAGLGVAGPDGPMAPRYRSYQWNGNHDRIHAGAQWRPDAQITSGPSPNAIPSVRQTAPAAAQGQLSWKASPRIAETHALSMAHATHVSSVSQPKPVLPPNQPSIER